MSAGKIALDITPRPKYPRSSEGDFITLADGRILFAYTRFEGSSSDHGRAVIAARVSGDGGRTWPLRDRVLIETEGQMNVMSVSLLRLADGRIALFYLIKNGPHDCRAYMRTSQDEARSFTRPTLCVPAPGYFVTNNDRVVQLSTGRLVVPGAYHRRRLDATEDLPGSSDGRGIAMFFLSDDAGNTWREAKDWWALPERSSSGLQEPGVIELADGSLSAFCRTDRGRQWGMASRDGGDTWSTPKPMCFESPCAPLSIKRMPGGQLLAVWCDHSGRFGMPIEESRHGRNPLVSAVSDDEGKTWTSHRPIETDPRGRFCYIAIHFPDKASVLLAYNAGGSRPEQTAWGALRIRRVSTKWLLSGQA